MSDLQIPPLTVPPTRTLTAAGLATGGGNLSADRTITVTAATQGDQETGTGTTTAVTPGVQKFHPSAAKAWVRFNGTGTLAAVAVYNVSSINDNGTGNYTVNLTTSFSSGSYAVVAQSGAAATGTGALGATVDPRDLAAGSFVLLCYVTSSGALADHAMVCAAAYGDQ